MKKKSVKGWVARQLVAKAVNWRSLRPYQRESIMQVRQTYGTLKATQHIGKTALIAHWPAVVANQTQSTAI